VIQAITKTPWAITADGLELVLGIAQRKICDYEAIASANPDKKASGGLSVIDGVAVLNVTGSIFPRADIFTNISGATSVEKLSRNFSAALNDKSVKAILLNIDSPGGKITGIHEFAEMIYNARGIKPIQAYISALGASAAYWIATAADRIYMDVTAMAGSIGVIAAWTDETKAKEMNGCQDYHLVSSKSPNKNVDLKTQKGKELLLKELDALADIFIADVARNRNVSVEKVESDFGQGGIVIASEAIKLGMADGLNSLEGILKMLSLTKTGDSLMNTEQQETPLIEAAAEADLLSSKSLDNKNPPPPLKTVALDEAKANLLASNPKLYGAIMQEGLAAGIAQENARLKAIDEMSAVIENKDLIQEAKFGNPISAQELAYKLVKAESQAGRKFSADYAADAAEISNVAASMDAQGKEYDSDVSAIVAGAIGVKNG